MPDTEDVSVLIEGTEFSSWTSVEIHRQVDSFSTIGFAAPFDSGRREMRETFRPYSYKPLVAKVDGAALFTGTMVVIDPESTETSSTVRVSGYSGAGVFADCPAPASLLPIEFKGLGLEAIAKRIAEPFGIDVEFSAEEGSVFAKAKLDVETGILTFLANLAQQRNLVIGNTSSGAILFQQSIAPGNPVARLTDGAQPVQRVVLSTNPQEYYSEITGFSKKKRGRKGSRFTVQNPRLDTVLRPFNFQPKDTAPADVPAAVRAKLGRMFANAMSYTVDVATWRDPSGELWAPNTTVTLLAPDAMVYRETELLVRGVKLRQNIKATSATLNLILPGAFSGQVPDTLPWEDVPDIADEPLARLAAALV